MHSLYSTIDALDSYAYTSRSWETRSELDSLKGFSLPNVDREMNLCERIEKKMKKTK